MGVFTWNIQMKIFLLIGFAALFFPVCAGELRIVSYSPALTELVCHLQKEQCLVGRSVSCDRPGSVKKLPAVGDFGKPDLEKLARLKPDLVLADTFQDAAIRRSMEALGIRVVVLPLNSMADYRHAVKTLGDRLDAPRSKEELQRVDTILADFKRRHPAGKKCPSVMYVVWHTPMMLPGRQSFLTEWIRLAGGDPLGKAHDRSYFRAAPEWVLKMKPDILIFPGGDPAAIPAWWKSLPAVRNKKIFFPEDESLFYRLSPRFDRALAELEKMIYLR